tara:strand:- start:3500 stop:3634 length:135 start_codon:yes stop_codon:yes gene_type:complete
MKQYWQDYWLANIGCVPDGLDLIIVMGIIIITSTITIKVNNKIK